MSRFLILLLTLGILTACGGGGGGGSTNSAPAPGPSDPQDEPTQIEVLDGVPGEGIPDIDPGHSRLNLAHLGHSDLEISFSADCANIEGNTIRRGLLDVAQTDFDEVLDHQLTCAFTENTGYSIDVDGTRSNDARFRATRSFATGTEGTPGLIELDSVSVNRATIDDLFREYVEGALITQLDLPSGVESLIVDLVIELAEANWDNLTDPDALYPVTSQRVSYRSRTPSGSPSSELTGLVAWPIVNLSPDFAMRDKAIVLTHATGSTPGDLNAADAWFILANLIASRGYLVIAPDNYGRGGTSDEPETYLMSNRTAFNALDLVEQALADDNYTGIYDGTDISIVGYSQGGHTAMALWHLLASRNDPAVTIREVYAGGAPHNLYQTFRGVLRHINGSCDNQAYCEYVDTETTVPFATDRILPGFFEYTETGLSISDAISGDTIDPDFVNGFLNNAPELDTLKALLQLNSLTGITNAELFAESEALVHLYHSAYDRLVPIENTEELAGLLSPHINLDWHENRCHSDGYEVIFNLTERVGVLHTLCGLAVLDDAMNDLK